MRTERLWLSHGLVYRVTRPFIVLAMLIGLLFASALSSAIATEFLADEEAQLTRLLNQERIGRGLPALGPNDGLRTVARRHSQRMMVEGTIFHSTTLQQEVQAIFPNWASIGENVGVSPSVGSVHTAFMNSPGHRANILDPDWGYLGIGIVSGGSRMFSTQNFLELQAGVARPLPVATRVAGSDRFLTAAALSDFAFLAGSAAGAVVADGADFHGALAGAANAGQLSGPVLLTSQGSLGDPARQAIDRVVASGGELLAVGVGSISGGTRTAASTVISSTDYAQAAADLARELSTRPTHAFVATITNYPDALAASAVAATNGWPVLYTDPAGLSPATAKVIRDLGIGNVHIVGGSNSVSATVESQLRDLGARVDRLSGPERYSTAVSVATFGLNNGLRPEQILIATGRNFPDALAAGGAAGVLRAPVLLVETGSVPGPTASFLRQHGANIDQFIVVGGPNTVSDAVLAQLPSLTR